VSEEIQLREEVEILSAEIERLTTAKAEKKPSWVVRIWRRMFPRLVYGGPETCGHCVHWIDREHPKGLEWKDDEGNTRYALGDCKLLYGDYDKTYKATCDRFHAKREFMHRERS